MIVKSRPGSGPCKWLAWHLRANGRPCQRDAQVVALRDETQLHASAPVGNGRATSSRVADSPNTLKREVAKRDEEVAAVRNEAGASQAELRSEKDRARDLALANSQLVDTLRQLQSSDGVNPQQHVLQLCVTTIIILYRARIVAHGGANEQ